MIPIFWDVAEMNVARTCELNRGEHEPRTVDVLARGAVDGVDGAATQLQPPTAEKERHFIEKVRGKQMSVRPRGSLQTQKRPA